LTPTTGSVPRNTNQTLTISGMVLGTDYQNALMGLLRHRSLTILP
jgi:hypothetical protein